MFIVFIVVPGTAGVILPPNWLIMKKVVIPTEIAIIATFMKWGPDPSFPSSAAGTLPHAQDSFAAVSQLLSACVVLDSYCLVEVLDLFSKGMQPYTDFLYLYMSS